MKQTPLHALHQALGARMVPFAGYEMPVQYPQGVLREHLHTRAHAGLFDVSHMGQVLVRGAGATAALERLMPADLAGLAVGRQAYSLFTNETGGILDDLIITRWGDEEFFVVVNAACKEQDLAYLRSALGGQEVIEFEDRALLALQGPRAAELFESVAPEARALVFMSGAPMDIDGAACFVTRSGYTGEDGFEISLPARAATALAQRLLAIDGVWPIGLGARDSLRLEAGLCLYGHDMNASTTAVEAGLQWAIARARRPGGARAGGYPGAAALAEQLERGTARKRVGLVGDGKTPVREGTMIVDQHAASVGQVCSGGFAPSFGGPVAMAYVDSAHAAIGTRLQAVVRDRPRPVTVATMPFVARRYFRG